MPGRGNSSSAVATVTGLNSDLHILSQRLSECVSTGMDSSLGLAGNIAEHCTDDESLMDRTKAMMEGFVAMEEEIEQYVQAINLIKNGDADVEGGTDLVQVFEEKLQEVSATRKPLRDHPQYRRLEDQLAPTHNIEEQLATLRGTLLGDTQDDDIAMTETDVNIKCPYTCQPMTEPVRNTRCGHVYDRQGIVGHIRVKKGKARCPVSGCGNREPIKESHLEDHTDLRRYITLMARLNP